LTAAIDLAQHDYEVTVYEREDTIGGVGSCVPAVHMTPLHFEDMNAFIGFDVRPCFSDLKVFKAYIYSKIVHFDPRHLYVTERGAQKTSLDSYLYRFAQQQGVHFEFSHPLTPSMLTSLPDHSIIAVGSSSGLRKQLKLRCTPFIHFDGHDAIESDDTYCLAYFDSYIGGYRYAYVAAMNHLVSGEIDFFVHQPYKTYLPAFQKRLKETSGLEFTNWRLVQDTYPEQLQLLKKIHGNTYVLAGAVGGFHDPFFGFGVNSALVSGAIAAMTVMSKKRGMQEFARFARDLERLYLMSKLYNYIPLRHKILPRFFTQRTSTIPIVGKSLQCVPGFTHDDWFKVVSIE
jgi:flavin-dependent dehydrogenase